MPASCASLEELLQRLVVRLHGLQAPGTYLIQVADPPLSLQGPGMIVNDELKDTIRSHLDLDKGNAKFTRKASKVCAVLCDAFVQFNARVEHTVVPR